MKIDKVVVGDLQCNCYLLEINGKVLVIDPGDEADKIIDKIERICIEIYGADGIELSDDVIKYINNLERLGYGNLPVCIAKTQYSLGDREVVGIIITHYHFDHIGAKSEIVNKYNVLVYDRNNMIEGLNKIDDFMFNVIYTPGHKEDLITIYFKEDKVMFCGDFIFRGSIGRCDLPGGDIREMINSINKIKKYDRDIIIYSGHGDSTSIGYEINNNMYFLDIDLI